MTKTLTKEQGSVRENSRGQNTMDFVLVILAIVVAAFFVYRQFGTQINDVVKSFISKP